MTDRIAGRRRGLKLGALIIGGFGLLAAYFLPVAELGAGGVGIGSIPVCIFPIFAVIILWEGPTEFSTAFLAGGHLFTQAFVTASFLVLLIRRRQWCFMTARLWVMWAGLVFLATVCLLFFSEPVGVGALLFGVVGPVFGVGVMLHLRRYHQHCFSDSDDAQPDVQADG